LLACRSCARGLLERHDADQSRVAPDLLSSLNHQRPTAYNAEQDESQATKDTMTENLFAAQALTKTCVSGEVEVQAS
jgi:hypothetical protein